MPSLPTTHCVFSRTPRTFLPCGVQDSFDPVPRRTPEPRDRTFEDVSFFSWAPPLGRTDTGPPKGVDTPTGVEVPPTYDHCRHPPGSMRNGFPVQSHLIRSSPSCRRRYVLESGHRSRFPATPLERKTGVSFRLLSSSPLFRHSKSFCFSTKDLRCLPIRRVFVSVLVTGPQDTPCRDPRAVPRAPEDSLYGPGTRRVALRP